jgi:hypothetical protein
MGTGAAAAGGPSTRREENHVVRVERVDDTPNGSSHNGASNRTTRKRRLLLAHASGPEVVAHELIAVDEQRSVTVSRLRLWSVAKVAVVFWSCVGVLAIAGVLMTWLVLTSAGVIENFEEFIRDMTGVDEFKVLSGTVMSMLILLVCLGVVFATTCTVIAAEFYNIVARTLGGIEVVALEETVRIAPSASVATNANGNGDGQQVDGAASNGHADGDVVLKS